MTPIIYVGVAECHHALPLLLYHGRVSDANVVRIMGVDIVTGGLGFIGSHLVDALRSAGREVFIIDNKHDPLNDIRLNLPLPQKVDRIFHLAALADIVPSIENPTLYYDTNVTGTLMALETARRYNARFIYAASASCYGNKPVTPTPECNTCDPQYPYALTKRLGEEMVLHWSKVYKIPAISLRLFNVYGTRSRTNGTYGAMFGTFLAQMANNKPITIVGDGTQKRDFIHVSDVVKAFIKAADSDGNGVYNVGSGKPVSVNEIADILGAGDRIYLPKRPGEPDVTCADIHKITRELDWKPSVDIKDGIADLLANIEYWKDAPVWDAENIGRATKRWFECLS